MLLNQSGSVLSSTNKPVSLRNVVREGSTATVNTIESIGNVEAVNKVDGAFLQYNSSTLNYEVVEAELDGGTF